MGFNSSDLGVSVSVFISVHGRYFGRTKGLRNATQLRHEMKHLEAFTEMPFVEAKCALKTWSALPFMMKPDKDITCTCQTPCVILIALCHSLRNIINKGGWRMMSRSSGAPCGFRVKKAFVSVTGTLHFLPNPSRQEACTCCKEPLANVLSKIEGLICQEARFLRTLSVLQ